MLARAGTRPMTRLALGFRNGSRLPICSNTKAGAGNYSVEWSLLIAGIGPFCDEADRPDSVTLSPGLANKEPAR
jgi:hypothetical protein